MSINKQSNKEKANDQRKKEIVGKVKWTRRVLNRKDK